MGDEGTTSGELIAEALVTGRVELGVKEDGGHMMRTVVLPFACLHLEEKKS